MQAALEGLREERRETSALVLAAEQEVAVWARRVQLESEMQVRGAGSCC